MTAPVRITRLCSVCKANHLIRAHLGDPGYHAALVCPVCDLTEAEPLITVESVYTLVDDVPRCLSCRDQLTITDRGVICRQCRLEGRLP